MWPDLNKMPIEDYEYALAGKGKGVYGRPPLVFHLAPGVLASLIGGAFVLGAVAGWRLASLAEE